MRHIQRVRGPSPGDTGILRSSTSGGGPPGTFPGVPEYSPQQARSLVQRSVATAQWQSRNFQETDERGDVIGKQLEVLVLDGGPLAIATDADGKHVVVLWPPVTDG